MAYLPLANILHYKLRSALSAVGIGIGICMLITLSGLARGTLYEVADRWEAVDADVIVFPRGWGDNASDKSGSGLADAYAGMILDKHGDVVAGAVPVFTWNISLGGQNQMIAGVDADQWRTLTGGRSLTAGRMYDPQGLASDWLEQKLLTGGSDQPIIEHDRIVGALADRGGLEMVVDSRLARAGGYRIGQTVFSANHHWKIVGIVPAGVMTRVFMPRRTAQYLFGNGEINKSTLMFLKLKGGVDVGPISRRIERTIGQDVVPLGRYRGMLEERFGVIFRYVDAVNVVALIIAFLFIMVTLYMIVLQRVREIAILKSCGASNAFILRQVLAESMLLTGAGTLAGIALSFAAKWAIEQTLPLYTVDIGWRWIGIAVALAAVGAVTSALFPAWRATRVDVIEALTFE